MFLTPPPPQNVYIYKGFIDKTKNIDMLKNIF